MVALGEHDHEGELGLPSEHAKNLVIHGQDRVIQRRQIE
jgi:hypothetical protein